MRRQIPQVIDGKLIVSSLHEAGHNTIAIDSPAWFSWINNENNTSFSIASAHGSITIRREQQRHGHYWYAYRWYEKKLHKSYIGKSEELTYQRLLELTNSISESTAQIPPSLSFFGKPVVVCRNQHIEKLSQKALLLLAYLAVHKHPQTRAHLMALLWAESSEEAARKNLRNTLWAIRTLLGEQVIQGNASLHLDRSLSIDVWTFEQEITQITHIEASSSKREDLSLTHYQNALALYRGTFLDGIAIEDSSEMQLWLLLEREHLKQTLLKVLLALIDAARTADNWSLVLDLAHDALLEDPLQEPIYRFQMEALARLGERSQALHQYTTLRTVLEHELGVQPLSETEALRTAILQGTLQSAAVTRSEHSSSLSTRHPSISAPLRLPFAGRQAELTLLNTEFQLAADGTFRIVLLTGDTGIGKSRLWQEWTTKLTTQKRAMIVDLLALEVMQGAPFASLLMWFNQSPWSQQLFSPTSHLSPAVQSEILRRLPTIQPQWNNLPQLPVQSQEAERLRAFEVLTQSLLAIQEHEGLPLVLCLDDAQWSDSMTIQWFGYLAQRLRTAPFLLVLAYRPDEASPALSALVAHWQYQRVAHHLPLPGLNEEEAQTVMESSSKDVLEKQHLYQQSGGNPYILSELLQVPSGNIPTSLVGLIQMHIAHLPELARQALQAAAILEPGIDFETLRRTCGRSEDEMLDALDELTRTGFLTEASGHYAFNRPLVATIMRKNLSGPRRFALHRRAAKACELVITEQFPLIVRQMVVYYQGTGEREQAAHYAEIAAEQARAMTDWEEAIRLCQQARSLAPTPARTLHLGQVLLEKCDFEEAQAVFKVAFHEYQAQGNQQGAARASLNVASVALKERRSDEVFLWTQQALSILTIENDPEGLALAHALLNSIRV